MSYEEIEFAVVLGGEGMSPVAIRDLLRDARTIHRVAERKTNGYYDTASAERDERRDAAATQRIVDACAPLGIVTHFQGDPRGAVVKLRLPSGRSNDFGGEGYYCVPT